MWIIIILCGALFIYHHVLYPVTLKFLAKRKKRNSIVTTPLVEHPRIGVLMCAYNEQDYIRAKLDNLAMLDYPTGRFDIHIGLDGCTDNTEMIVDAAMNDLLRQRICCSKQVNRRNQGKIATLNQLITEHKQDYDILLFTDTSALLSIDALQKVASAFHDPTVGVVSGSYEFLVPLVPEQQKYWQYQNRLKRDEGALGAVIGVPGAMYAMRAELVEPVPMQTINDDFLMPMRALEKGYQAVVDPDLSIVELESDSASTDRQRRIRIGAGNIQQLWMLKNMLKPRYGWAAFNFFSGKGLRAVMPIILFTAACSLATLAVKGDQLALGMILSAVLVTCLPSVLRWTTGNRERRIPVLSSIEYLVTNYAFAFMGVTRWLLGRYACSWRSDKVSATNVIPLSVRIMKRCIDIMFSLFGLVLLSPVLLVTAVLVKLTSEGPVFYKQLRVGLANERSVSLFHVIKFRTMVQNAEKSTGAVWAQKDDPRITALGRWLRKTRVDELPQLWNVFKGEMSLVGPRPERPDFHSQLEFQIPMFCERTYGIKPGITGLAQVNDAYPNDIAGMRQKLAWDMAYSLTLSNPLRWLKSEIAIMFATVRVILLAKGQ
ncbi:sugar transferase [Aestuariibacter salexigens]|uniref:sugar transferase n=1 Tax=Aestuariibacter salexigens TaxID=226010 RepID=UPI0023E392CA|nr:sugar transferase [Aestuariibacter salexigens]